MIDDQKYLVPAVPPGLENVDIVHLRFVLDFISACTLKPADFLALGRILKVSGRQFVRNSDPKTQAQWETLFHPPLSADPVALRKHQKPTPAFVMNTPITKPTNFDVGDQLDYEVLFIGTGISLTHVFLHSIIHLGRLGLVAGEGQFDVREVISVSRQDEPCIWRQGSPVNLLPCKVTPLNWLLESYRVQETIKLDFVTPARLLVKGKPLRRPSFSRMFPFLLRRVTSMLNAHSDFEIYNDIPEIIEAASNVEECRSRLEWRDWRSVGQHQTVVGGFLGELEIKSQRFDEFFWIVALASLLGVGKGATYGAGHYNLVT